VVGSRSFWKVGINL